MAVKPWAVVLSPAPSFIYWLLPSHHLHWFWPPILQDTIWKVWNGRNLPFGKVCSLFTLAQLSVLLLFVHWAATLGNGLVTSGVSMWQHWNCQFKPVLFLWHHLMCGELTLQRCLDDGNWMWICHKLSAVTVLREPKSPNVKYAGMESWL